ncbi:MAG: hypothetical protein Q4G64_01395, partial [bacterium]|nr:hypothetical protein [bacterium]
MRRFTVATAATAALLLSACGGATDPADPTPAPTTEVAPTPTPTLEPAPTTEPAAPTEEPTVEPTV